MSLSSYFNVPYLPLNFYSSFYRIFITMSGNPIISKSDLKGSVSSSLERGMKFKSYSFLFVNRGIESGIIILSDDLKMEKFSGISLLNETLSMNTT